MILLLLRMHKHTTYTRQIQLKNGKDGKPKLKMPAWEENPRAKCARYSVVLMFPLRPTHKKEIVRRHQSGGRCLAAAAAASARSLTGGLGLVVAATAIIADAAADVAADAAADAAVITADDADSDAKARQKQQPKRRRRQKQLQQQQQQPKRRRRQKQQLTNARLR